MALKKFTLNSSSAATPKIKSCIDRFENLLIAIDKKEISESVLQKINVEIVKVNTLSLHQKKTCNEIYQSQKRIIKILEKELKLVPKNYYRNLWMILGLASFGVPIGVALGLSFGNMAFMGTGIPFGMIIGMGVGASMDQKAASENRQLDFDQNI